MIRDPSDGSVREKPETGIPASGTTSTKSRRHWRAAARRVRKSNVMKCTQPRQSKLRPRSTRRKSKCVVPMQEQKFCC
jgi:hypothetical protein